MTTTRISIAAATIIAATLTLSACAPSADAPAGDGPAASFNDADIMFARMMIPHHTQAVEMSDMILEKEGISAETIDLAEQIKEEQQPEIDQLNGFLEEWDAEPGDAMENGGMENDDMEGDDMGGMDNSMSGMMSDDDMDALDDADGVEAERLFLEQMTEHHEGAVEMAGTEISDGENADAIALAESIVEAQEEEITRMEQLLAAL